jgi:hypothetical protein
MGIIERIVVRDGVFHLFLTSLLLRGHCQKKVEPKKARPLGIFLENYISFYCLHPNSQTPLANFQTEN